MNTYWSELVVVLAALFVPAVAALVRGWRTTPRQVDRWLAANRLDIDETHRPLVTSYLRRTRRFRGAGFALGWMAMVIGRLVYLLPVVYLLAVAVGELTRARPSGHAAVLRSHRIRDHLPRWALPTAIVATAVTIVSVVAYDAIDRVVSVEISLVDETVFMVVTCVVGAIAWALSALLARRRFLVDSVGDAHLEEAMRGSEIRSVLGPAIGVAVMAAVFDLAGLFEGGLVFLVWTAGLVVGAWVIARLSQWSEPSPVRA